jgi:hypothetical protein
VGPRYQRGGLAWNDQAESASGHAARVSRLYGKSLTDASVVLPGACIDYLLNLHINTGFQKFVFFSFLFSLSRTRTVCDRDFTLKL